MNGSGSSPGIALALLLAGLAGCEAKPVAAPKAVVQAGGYLSPPTISLANRKADGGVHLSGHAPPQTQISLRAPDGADLGVHSGVDGAWSLDVPPAAAPRLFAFEARMGSQVIHGEGALAVMPPPDAPVLLLRAGFAAWPGGESGGGLQLVAFDYDGGGAAVGGFAPPGSPVRMSIDGAIVGLSKADAQGRFAVLATGQGVAPGLHTLRLDTPRGLSLERRIEVKAPVIPAGKAFVADRVTDGWTLSWRLPGGSVQTSLVFDLTSAGGQ